MDAKEPNGGERGRPIDDDEPGMLGHWRADEADPGFLNATPPDASAAERLRLRFPTVPPAPGTQAREEWDQLGLGGDANVAGH